MTARSLTMPWMLIVAALCCMAAGMATAIQGPTNASLIAAVGSPINAALVSFAIGTTILLVLALVLRARPDMAAVGALPWWSWMGGAYGVFFVCMAAFWAPRMGVAFVITLMIAGQLILGLLLDHFGAFGMAERPVSWPRVAGVALVFLGVVIARRG